MLHQNTSSTFLDLTKTFFAMLFASLVFSSYMFVSVSEDLYKLDSEFNVTIVNHPDIKLPAGVAVLHESNSGEQPMVYLTHHPDYGNQHAATDPEDPILELDLSGQVVGTFGSGVLLSVHSIVIQQTPEEPILWIMDPGNHCVRKYSHTGELLDTLGVPGQAGTELTPTLYLDHPDDIAFDEDGNIYIADAEGGVNWVVKLTAQHEFVYKLGTEAASNASSHFHLPHSLAVDPYQRLWVADRRNDRLQVFDCASGQLLAILTCGLHGPTSVRIDGERGLVFVIESGLEASEDMGKFYVMKLPPDGALTPRMETCDWLQVTETGLGSSPHLMALDPLVNSVYVVHSFDPHYKATRWVGPP